MFNPYLGKKYSTQEIKDVLDRYSDCIRYMHYCDIGRIAAGEIADGRIIAWFQDGAECGPRALGNRSILADARNADMKDILNHRVKFREAFRPFAPSVLWEYQMEYFNLDIPSPYMLMVSDIRPERQPVIPAATHVDGTGRVQTVMKELNPKFYNLIEHFFYLTGVPVVLNTSFNVKGEPIVESPEDALRCFLGTAIDTLILDDFHVERS